MFKQHIWSSRSLQKSVHHHLSTMKIACDLSYSFLVASVRLFFKHYLMDNSVFTYIQFILKVLDINIDRHKWKRMYCIIQQCIVVTRIKCNRIMAWSAQHLILITHKLQCRLNRNHASSFVCAWMNERKKKWRREIFK